MFHLDAFADRLFAGNPAAVCLLNAWLPVPVMQSIAAENRLSETAFVMRDTPVAGDPAGAGPYQLRWFTPTTEMPMCGHATLAAAHVILTRLEPGADQVMFKTKGGPLRVQRRPAPVRCDGTVSSSGQYLRLDLPHEPLTPRHPDSDEAARLSAALGGLTPARILAGSHDWYVLADSAEAVANCRPDPVALAALPPRAVAIASLAHGAGVAQGADYVCRFFAPRLGVDEDPVTGIAHAGIAPLIADALGRNRVEGLQLSARRGRVWAEPTPGHVSLTGRVIEYSEGTIALSIADITAAASHLTAVA
ncbi:putative isomerase [Tistrella bauzanensis]|uniref:Isomerase n=1 Tax=Tistrella bauzanensis TaxID=657419 RepID=A0ABQ1J2E0_9PROT|nr:PhzF family phenazine biosynthesis protein [Tistrella bauzanensis]GGB58274.1 putative isomerase [Tistrella bauzanensis]